MAGRKHKSRTYRRIFTKTPSGTVIHYKKRKPSKAKCAVCKKVLLGVASERKYKMMNMPKSQKRVSRKYGGNLCSKCARKKIISEARQ